VKRELINLSLASKIFFYGVFTFLYNSSTNAQIANFVSNGGFEKYYSCSQSFSLLGYIVTTNDWDEIDDVLASKWNHYCYGAVPYNNFFYNYPRTDSAYVSFDAFCLNCSPSASRTNIRNTLKGPLIAGSVYCVKFYINNSEKSSHSINSIDAYFGGDELDTISKAHVALTYINPQISNSNLNYLSDTIGWKLVSGTFTAQGGEKYMLIGNLRSDIATNSIISNSIMAAMGWTISEIAIDDVSCIDIDLPAFAGPDTYVVAGGSVYIGRPRDVGIDEACIWYKLPNNATSIDTAAGIWVSPTTTSTYVVVQDICGNINRDTVVVSLSGVGISELEGIRNDIKLFPNPANDIIQIQYSLDISDPFTKVSFYNNLGQLINEGSIIFKNKKGSIPISNFENGVYSLELKNAIGQIVKQRFVVAR
jgi:hypothetical protein